MAKKLTRSGQVGLCTDPEFHRLGVFMIQAGGWLVSKDGKTATVNSKAEHRRLQLRQVDDQGRLDEAHEPDRCRLGRRGLRQAALRDDDRGQLDRRRHDPRLPDRGYKVVELPAGPGGKGTLQYDGGWGLAAASKNKADAMTLISYLTATKVQMGNAKAFGVMPPVQGGCEGLEEALPAVRAVPGRCRLLEEHPDVPDIATVLGDFNQQLQGLPSPIRSRS